MYIKYLYKICNKKYMNINNSINIDNNMYLIFFL